MDREIFSTPEAPETATLSNIYLNENVDEEIQERIQRLIQTSFVNGYNVGFCDFNGKYADCPKNIMAIILKAFEAEGYSVVGRRNDFDPSMKITEVIGDYTVDSLILTKQHCSLGAIGMKAVRVKKDSKICLSWDVWNYYHNVLDDLV